MIRVRGRDKRWHLLARNKKTKGCAVSYSMSLDKPKKKKDATNLSLIKKKGERKDMEDVD